MEGKKNKKKYKLSSDPNSSTVSQSSSLPSSRVERPVSSSRLYQVHDFGEQPEEDSQMPFQFSFNKYVQLRLAKIIPPKDGVVIESQRKVVKASDEKIIKQFIKKVNEEMQTRVMKSVTLQNQKLIQKLEDEMEPQYKAKIYRPQLILLAIDDVVKNYGFSKEADKLRSMINKEDQTRFLVGFLKKYQKDCSEIMDRVLGQAEMNVSRISSSTSNAKQIQEKYLQDQRKKNNQNKKPSITKKNSSEEEVEVIQEESYYQIMNKSKILENQQDIDPSDSISSVNRPQNNNKSAISSKVQPNSNIIFESKEVQKEPRNSNKYFQKKQSQESRIQERPNEDFERGGRRKIRIDLIEEQYCSSVFNPDDFKKWVKRNGKIELNDIEISPVSDPYSQGGEEHPIAYKVILSSIRGQRKEEKIEQFRIYTQFQKTLDINTKNKQYKEQLFQRFTKNTSQITIKVVKGFKAQNWNSKNLWHFIEEGKIGSKKTQHLCVYMEVFHLKGLRTAVEKVSEQIIKALDEVPQDDMESEIYFDLPDIQKYSRTEKRVQQLIQEEIKHQFGKMPNNSICTIKEIECYLGRTKANMIVKYDKEDEYKILKNTLKVMVQNQIKIDKHDGKLEKISVQNLKKHLIVISHDEKQLVYIHSNRDTNKINKLLNEEINEGKKIIEKSITIKDKFILNKFKKYFQSKNKEYYENVKHFQKPIKGQSYEFQIMIYGPLSEVNCFINDASTFLDDVHSQISGFAQIIKSQEAEIIEENHEIQESLDKKYQITLKFSPNSLINAQITIQSVQKSLKKKLIFIRHSKKLDCVPLGSTIIFKNKNETDYFNESFLNTFKLNTKRPLIANYIQKQANRGYTLLMGGQKKLDSIENLLVEGINNSTAPYKFVIMMPDKDKSKFIRNLIEALITVKQFHAYELDIHIIQPKPFQEDITKIVGLEQYNSQVVPPENQSKVKWYVMDSTTKFYYSQKGNKKINQHLRKSKGGLLYLANEDVNITHVSHHYNLSTDVMTHIQSSAQVAARRLSDKIEYTLKNLKCTIPPNVYSIISSHDVKKVAVNTQIDISLGIYEINVEAMTQINMFSDYKRKLYKEQQLPDQKPYDFAKDTTKVLYNVGITELIYSFDQDSSKNIKVAINQINGFLKTKVITDTYDLEGINTTTEFKKNVLSKAQQFNVEVQINQNKKNALIKSYNPKNIKMMQIFFKFQKDAATKKIENAVQYPKEWQIQTQQIQTFPVAETSQQFLNVQKLFTCSKIKQLIRLQNSILYKKYYDQKQFLKSLNKGNTPKEMLLFHGTRATNPQVIYKDKEESFNINYSSENNLLGKGIYFAQKSEYSHGYRFTDSSGRIFGIGSTYSMFLCTVIVGESQKCPAHSGDYKDTSIKDAVNNLKYESMTDFLNNSNIFVVYKSRRAYPLYLIKY